jgi:hypothetical protein
MPTLHKYNVVRPVEKFVVNPPVRLAWRLGVGRLGDALLETIGRRSGRPQLTLLGQDKGVGLAVKGVMSAPSGPESFGMRIDNERTSRQDERTDTL